MQSRMKKNQWLLVGFISALIMITVVITVGCERRADGQEGNSTKELTLIPGIFQTNKVVRYYKDLPADGVLVQVGNRVLTRERFQELVDEWVALNQKTGPRIVEQKEEILEKEAYQYVFANFMARAAMLQEAEELKIKPSKRDLIDAELYFRRICKQLRLKRSGFADRFKGGEAFVIKRIQDEATLKALNRNQFGNSLEATDTTVASLRQELEHLQQEAAATNQMYKSLLMKVREQFISGSLSVSDDNAAMQAKMPAGVIYDGIVTCTAFELEDPVKGALNMLKRGSWSSVIEVGEWYQMYQLIEIHPHQEHDLTQYRVVRISAPLDPGWTVPDNNMLRRDININKRKEKQAPWAKNLILKYGVLFPNGVNLFGEIKTKTRGSAKKPKTEKVYLKEEK